ncbi:tetrathionate reductase family octaheme c-type cytochrome [bacterium]|nr:MAG: tetrathionate reductase family octaheme c-type cytochrome [bacterium]
MKIKEHKSTLTLLLILFLNIVIIALYQNFYPLEEPNLKLEELRIKYLTDKPKSVDHTKFAALQKDFKSPQEVTKTCISCHTERHTEVMESSHWNWERVDYVEGKGLKGVGKKNVLNNYCIGVAGNEMACASCHTGLGMASVKDFDFKKPENVDCLSCHASTGAYEKSKTQGGFPANTVNLSAAALTVGKPTIDNCGNCHFYSGGGNNVKHGDLEEALFNADRKLDIHLAKDGINMTCVDCHQAPNHQIKGRLYSVSSNNVSRAYCEDCHTTTPHMDEMLNTHTAKVACQTCHIPTYAKANPTKMTWKWSEAGHLDEKGNPITLNDTEGEHVYMSIKGTFTWGKNLKPEYVWFNGKADHYFLGDRIDTTKLPVKINELLGSHDDPESKIIPVKVHRGDQIYDSKNLMLIQPKLYSPAKGDSAFWKDFDWKTAAEKGMKDVNLPFSGEYGFIPTEMYWPVNHMVSKANESLQCADCHTPKDGRLAQLTGFYLPGRDRNSLLDNLGLIMIFGALFGVVAHASMRTVAYLKDEKEHEMPKYEGFDKD